MTKYTYTRLAKEYESLWSSMQVTEVQQARAQAARVCAAGAKTRYKAVEARTGVPWFVVGCLHMRESTGDFSTYLGNGQPLDRRTTIVPKGRGPWPNFEEGAYDALVTVERLNEIEDWGPAHVAYAMEKFNGFGYRNPSRNIPSPYLWGGTNVQKRGKFVRDGVYDPNTMDPQIGGMAVLRQIMEIDPEARFPKAKLKEKALPAPQSPQTSPKAEDSEVEVKPLVKSKTIWGGALQAVTGFVASVIAFVQGMPPWLVALIVVAILVGVWLVVKGRIDVDRVVRHLSSDDAEEGELS